MVFILLRDQYFLLSSLYVQLIVIDALCKSLEGLQSREIDQWDEEEDGGDPPRLWKPGQMYPGTAFTRSIGDRSMPSAFHPSQHLFHNQ